MTNPENPNPQDLVKNTFRSAIGRMRKSENRVIRDTAKMIGDLEKLKLLHVVPDTNQFRNNSVSDFGFVEVKPGTLFQPTIIVKPDFLLSQPEGSIDADLLRTCTIARQYVQTEPRQFYQDRLVDVYGRAIQSQEEWLKEHPASLPRSIDPRVTPREEVIKKLIGPKRFYCDTGIADWFGVVDEAEKWSEKTGMQLYSPRFIEDLRATPRDFIFVRDMLVNDAAENLYQQYGEGFSDLTADQRAGLVTNEYLKITYASYASNKFDSAQAN